MSDICVQMEKFGKGIGNALRYSIIRALSKGPKTVTEIVKIVGKSQPTVSQHLKTLKGSGLIVDERHGQTVVYSINAEYLLELLSCVANEVQKTKAKKMHS